MHQHAKFNDTVYFWFGSNDTSGSGDDGASPICDVRLAGAAAGAAPVYEPTPILLTHANYMDGAHEVAIAATAGNGFADGNTYAVFCSLLVDGENPTGFVGSFTLDPIIANVTEISDDATAATNAESFFDGTGYAGTGNTIPTVTNVSNQVTADVTAISGDAVAANNAESFFDGTGYAGTNNVIPTVTTLTGHTPQTGDSFVRLGAPAGASVSADVAAVLAAIAALNDFDSTADNVIVGSVLAAALDDYFSVDSGNTYAGSVAGSVVKEIVDNVTATVNLGDFFDTDSGETYGTSVAGSVVKEIADNAGCGGSIGAVEFTYTVTETGTGALLEGAVVWFATDIGGANIVWTGVSDAFGIARATSNNEKPFLDPGTYYVWTQLSGYTFTNPDTEVVS